MTKNTLLAFSMIFSAFLLSSEALALSNVACTPANPTVNTSSNYTVNFRTGGGGSSLSAGVDYINITFPSDTIVPASINGAQIMVSTGTPTAVTQNATASGQTLSILTPINIGNNNNVTVVISTGASSLVNPSIPRTTYQIQVDTSSEPGNVNSSNYTISASGTAVTLGSISLTNNTINTASGYTVPITLGAMGALSGGTGQIVLNFPADTTVPASIPAAQVTVDGTPCAVAATGSGQNLTITVPADLANSAAFSVIISAAGNIVNPSTAGTQTLQVHTTNQTGIASGNYTINASATAVTLGSISLTNTTINTASGYTIPITLGAMGALGAGAGQIMLDFPTNTAVPASIPAAQITVNGSPCAVAATGSGQVLTITTPVNIANSATFSVVISAAGNITNPSLPNTYNLQVHTTSQTGIASGSYTINASATAVTLGSITLTNNTIGTVSGYTVPMTLGAMGALGAGIGQIIFDFPSDTFVPASIAGANITVNGTPCAVAATGSGQVLTITTPVSLSGGASFSVVISAAGNLTNPTLPNTYTLQVHTSSQTGVASGNFAINASSTAVTLGSITLTNTTVSTASGYTVPITLGSVGALGAGTGQILFTFPSDTIVPVSIPGAQITVNGTPCSAAASGSGQTLTITTPVSLAGGASFNVVIAAAGNLTNPTFPNTYNLQARTSSQTGVASGSYTINASATAVTLGSIILTNTTVNTTSGYTVPITLGTAGALGAGTGQIILTFPSDTTVPASIPGAQITVNGTPCSVAATGSGQTLTVTVPALIAGGATFNLIIGAGGNLVNPSIPNTYALQVHTSAQTGVASGNITISASGSTVTLGTISLTSTTVNTLAGYTIPITLGAAGALGAGTGQIILNFPPDTTVPASIAGSEITVNGTPCAVAATGSGQVLTLTTPAALAGGAAFNVVIDVAGGLRNPSAPNTYALQVHTSAQAGIASGNYAITASASAVTLGTISLTNSTVNANSGYTIPITLGAVGTLAAGTGQIILTFPSDTTVPASIPAADITVNGVTCLVAASAAGKTLTITNPALISGGATFNVVLDIAGNLANPSTPNTYALQVHTSAQAGIASGNYTISASNTAVTGLTVSANPTTVNRLAAYAVHFVLGAVGALSAGSGQIFLTFPDNTLVPASIPGAQITINAVPCAVAASGSGQTLTLTCPALLTGGASVDLAISTGFITNASVPGSHTLSVHTSSQIGTATASYGLTAPLAASVSNVTVDLGTFSRAGEAGQYTIGFSTGQFGRLGAGNVISITFPAGTGMPGSMTGSQITINGTAVTGTVNPVGQRINLTVPAGVSVGNNSLVTVVIDAAANIINPPIGANFGNYQLPDVHTDAEPTAVVSQWYTVSIGTPISTPQVAVAPPTIFANAQYTVDFTIGAGGSLIQGIHLITLTFPSAITLPGSFPASSVSVNGVAAAFVSKQPGNVVEITSPVNITATPSNVHVVFSTAAGLVNPALPGNFTLTAFTSIQNTVVTSNVFTISPSTSTFLTQPQVSLFPAFTRSFGRYRLNFNLGNLGGLLGGTSTLSIQFPANTEMPGSVPAGRITLNGQPVTTSTISGQVLTLTVPVTLAVNAAVELIIDAGANLRNPNDAGDYTLSVWTSSEPTPVASTSYHIAIATWNDIIAYPNPLAKQNGPDKLITFFLIPANTATLRIYTLDGMLVKTLSKNDAGDKIVWDVKNESGSYIASGIYIYNITGPGGSKKGKLAIKN